MHKDTLPFSPREEKAAILYILSTTDTQREVRVLIEYFNLKLWSHNDIPSILE